MVAKFESHEDATKADAAYYRQLTPAQRLRILRDLIEEAHPDFMQKDFREFIESLNSIHVDFVIVGGYALAFHGVSRYTGDIDFLVRMSPENAARLERSLNGFGFASLGITANDFLQPGRVVQLGFPPFRIDIVTSISGVDFDEIWERRVSSELDGVPVHFIDRDSFIKNKRATGRAKDKADLEALGTD